MFTFIYQSQTLMSTEDANTRTRMYTRQDILYHLPLWGGGKGFLWKIQNTNNDKNILYCTWAPLPPSTLGWRGGGSSRQFNTRTMIKTFSIAPELLYHPPLWGGGEWFVSTIQYTNNDKNRTFSSPRNNGILSFGRIPLKWLIINPGLILVYLYTISINLFRQHLAFGGCGIP